MVINDGPPLNRMLKVLTIDAFAMARAKDARLEALTVFLQTG